MLHKYFLKYFELVSEDMGHSNICRVDYGAYQLLSDDHVGP